MVPAVVGSVGVMREMEDGKLVLPAVPYLNSKSDGANSGSISFPDIPQGDKVRWLPIYHEPEHELVGRIQLNINYSTSTDENGHLKGSSMMGFNISSVDLLW